MLPKICIAIAIYSLACYSSNALKTAAVNAVVVFLANCYRYVFASVFPKVHVVISEAQWPNHHVLIVAKHGWLSLTVRSIKWHLTLRIGVVNY